MPEPVKKTTGAQPARQPQKTQVKPKQPAQQPSIGRLLINRAGAVIMAPIAAAAGALRLGASAVDGAVNPKKTFDQAMQEGVQDSRQGAKMLDKMWQGKFF